MVGALRESEGASGPSRPRIFYEKPINPAVRELLVGDRLNPDTFLAWWTSSDLKSDFWLELGDKLIRVHVTPRKTFFDPRKWTSQSLQRSLLLQSLGSIRETWGVACVGRRALSTVSELWEHAEQGSYPVLWVGRSVFNRASDPLPPRPLLSHLPRHEPGAAADMEDEQGPTPTRVRSTGPGNQFEVDRAGATRHPGQQQGRGGPDHGEDQRVGIYDAGGAASGSRPPGHSRGHQGVEGIHYAEDQRHPGARGNSDDAGTLSRHRLPRDSGELRGVGVGRGAPERGQHASRPEEICGVAPIVQDKESREGREGQVAGEDAEVLGTRGKGQGSATSGERDREHLQLPLVSGDLSCREESPSPPRHGLRTPEPLEARPQGHPDGRPRNPEDGTGSGSVRAERDPGARDPPSGPAGRPWPGSRTLGSSRRGDIHTTTAGEDAGETAHDAYHEFDVFESCSSGSEDWSQKHFAAPADFKEAWVATAHLGEQAARNARLEGDYCPETIAAILTKYEFPDQGKRRQGIHGLGGGTRCTLGYYAHGKFHGICKKTLRWPELVQYLNGYLKQFDSEPHDRRPSWTSLSIVHNLPCSMHVDRNNLKGSRNYTSCVGKFSGGQLWVEAPGGGLWRRDQNGEEEIEGMPLDGYNKLCCFDPRRRHMVESWSGDRWSITGFTARSFPSATKEEKRILRNAGFALPTNAELRKWNDEEKMAEHPSSTTFSSRPGSTNEMSVPRSRRKKLLKNAGALHVMMVTALAVMTRVGETYATPPTLPSISLLEVGGVSATCRLAEYGGNHIQVAEPILLEDLIENDHPEDVGFGYVETAVLRAEPGELWVHVRKEWADDGIYDDVMEAVDTQLRAGRGVVFQKDDRDDGHEAFWTDVTCGWEDVGYQVTHDYDYGDIEYVHVKAVENFNDVHEVFVGEGGENREDALQEGGGESGPRDPNAVGGREERGARAIRFPPSVPKIVASSLRRLHQNLGHPSTSDFVRHLRLAGAKREVLKAAKMLECQTCQRSQGPGTAKPAKVLSCLKFNEAIGADLFYCHDAEGKCHQFLSLVDFSSGYHVVTPVARKDTTHLEKAYCDSWLNVFGAPALIVVDLENGLEKV